MINPHLQQPRHLEARLLVAAAVVVAETELTSVEAVMMLLPRSRRLCSSTVISGAAQWRAAGVPTCTLVAAG